MTTTTRWILCAGALLASTLTFAQTGNQGSINFFDNYLEAKGLGVPGRNVDPKSPQGYTTAVTAARQDAQRQLLSTISGVQVDSVTLSEMNQVVQDSIRSAVSARLTGAQQASVSSMEDFIGKDPTKSGKVEVVLRVPLTGTGGVLNPLMSTLRPEIVKRIDAQALPTFQPAALVTPTPAPARGAAPAPTPSPAANRGATPAAPAPTAPPAPAAAAPEFDALLVKVPTGFKPALAPKIMSEKGEIVFSVKDVAADILISRGAAQYTNNEAKAKAMLDNMGAKSILSINGSLRTDTDAEVTVPDATKIYTSNKVTSLLSKGRVVFLVAAKN